MTGSTDYSGHIAASTSVVILECGSQGDAVRTQFRRTLHSVWARVEPSIGEHRLDELDDGQPLHQGGYSVRKAINGSIRVARRAGK